ncbi:MAG TPA: hypothetical protein VNK95_24380 [Caldilineaceae bacterium]|nr:hypothetical protein [Caldilineaceae bacterium]
MSSELGRAGFRIGVFVALTSGMLLLVLERDTAEFVLMAGTFGCASLFLAALAVLVRVLPR